MAEEAKYNVVRTIGDIELRQYEHMTLALVPSLPDNEAFGMLFRHIVGSNRPREENGDARREILSLLGPRLCRLRRRCPDCAPSQ